MAIIKPFKALRPQVSLSKQVASRPYDVMNSAEAKEEASGNENSFLHITKSEIDLPSNIDIHSQEVYDKAKENLDAFIKREILFQEDKACFYIYQLIMNDPHTGNPRSQTGLVCASSVADYENNIILKHEFTRPEKELDRINHIKTTKAQTGNVFLAYKNHVEVDEIIENWKQNSSPIYDFMADDGIKHTIWVVNKDEAIEKIESLFNEKIPFTYIADGHHRAASAAKVKDALGSEATENAHYFLTTLFPSNQLHIMDYNRIAKDLNNLSVEDFLLKVEENFSVTKKGDAVVTPSTLHEFGMYINGNWYLLTAKEGSYSTDPIGILDVSILQKNILSNILNIHDPRTDSRVDFVGGMRGLKELEKRVNNGEAAVAFSLYPVSIQQLFDISDNGQVMPPKSTWFEPKLRDGLLTHLIN